ncbi:hypothetical protein WA158_003984 [Blastocystis sp. Blastoise]
MNITQYIGIIHSIECSSSQVYLKYTFFCNICTNESIDIKAFVNNTEKIIMSLSSASHDFYKKDETCVDKSDDLLYSVSYTRTDDIKSDSFIEIDSLYNTTYMKKNYYQSKTAVDHFIVSLPLFPDQQAKYNTGSVSDNWFLTSFDDSTWQTIVSGDERSELTVAEYYRYTFDFTNMQNIASFTLGLDYTGVAAIYINENELFFGDKETNSTNSKDYIHYAKFIVSSSILTSHNILAIQIFPPTANNTVDSRHYLNLFITLHYVNYENNCAYTLPFSHFLDAIYRTSLPSAIDMKEYTTTGFSITNQNNAVTFALPQDTYIQPSLFSFHLSDSYSYPTTLSLDLYNTVNRTRDTSLYVQDNPVYHNNISFVASNIHYLYNQFQITFYNTSWGTDLIYLNELYIYTCSTPLQPLSYPQTTYIFNTFFNITAVIPSIYGYSQFSITPDLPEGIYMEPKDGSIRGRSLTEFPATSYTITAALPVVSSVTLTLSSELCSKSHLKIYRRYSEDNNSTAYITSTTTQQTIYTLPRFQARFRYYTDLCVDPDVYNMTLDGRGGYEKDTWDYYSYIYVYICLYEQNRKDDNFDNCIEILKERKERNTTNTFIFTTQFPLNHEQNWKHARDTLPVDWYKKEFNDADWATEKVGQSESTNHIDLYRTQFQIHESFVSDGSFELSVYYLYGVSIYINGIECFTYRIHDKTVTSVATAYYDQPKFRKITMPNRYLTHGDNTIAVMLMANTTDASFIRPSRFDCVLRIFPNVETYVFLEGSSVSYLSSAMDRNYYTSEEMTRTQSLELYSSTNDFVYITHYNMRMCYIVSEENWIDTWILQGRVYEPDGTPVITEEGWVTLHTIDHIYWDYYNNLQTFFLNRTETGDRVFNQYRMINVKAPDNRTLGLCELEFFVSSHQSPFPLFYYPPEPIYMYTNTYIPKVIPFFASYYTNYHSIPPLPQGLYLNITTGIITGIPLESSSTSLFTIEATGIDQKKYRNTVEIHITECINDRSKILIQYQYIAKNYWVGYTLTEDKAATGEVLVNTERISPQYGRLEHRFEDILQTRDYPLCVKNDYYFMKLYGHNTSWQFPTGFSVTDRLGFPIASGTSLYDPQKSFIFDVKSPIESGYTIWYYLNTDKYFTEWLDADFDFSQWKRTKGGNIHIEGKKYMYIRTYMNITDITEHSLLNFKCQTILPISIYINKNLDYVSSIQSLTTNNVTFSVFTQQNFIKSVNNIVGVLLEFPSSQNELYFTMDATYSYGQCNPLFMEAIITSSETSPEYPIYNMFDNSLLTYTVFPLANKHIINLDFSTTGGLLFNSIYIQPGDKDLPIYIQVLAKERQSFDWIEIVPRTYLKIMPMNPITLSVPMGIARYDYIQILFTAEDSEKPSKPFSLLLPIFSFTYCNYEGLLCSEDDAFPPMGENMYSYKVCGDGYQGYLYRFCDGLRLGTIKTEHCSLLLPYGLRYPQQEYYFSTYSEINDIVPSYHNIIQLFSITPSLPTGLFFNTSTGIITGMPISLIPKTTFIITGKNEKGVTNTTVSLWVVSGVCTQYMEFPQTIIGERYSAGCAKTAL